MFKFKNPNTPLIADNTIIEHNGKTFEITNYVFNYYYHIQCSDGKNAMVPMNGSGNAYDWKVGVEKVENTIREW